jgi:membrane protein
MLRTTWNLVSAAVQSWLDDYAPSMGAALAYYTMFSLAPLLLIVVSVTGLAFGEEAARGEVFSQVRGLIGEEGAVAVQGLLTSVSQRGDGVIGTLIGLIALLIGATTVFAELQSAMDRIWRAPAREKRSGIWNLMRARLLSFGIILGLGFLMIVSLLISAALAALGKWWSPLFGGWEVLAEVINSVASFGLVTAVFAMIYKFMPRVHIQWRDVWVGAAVTATLFTIGKFLIGLYIGRSGISSAFGAAASLAIVLVWVYYSAQIFLMGAEFTWVYAHTLGSRKGCPKPGPPDAIPSQTTAAADASEGKSPAPSSRSPSACYLPTMK